MKTTFTQRKFYIIYVLLILSIFLSRKSFAQCGTAGGNGSVTGASSITIDGNISDWSNYLNDPDNNTYDGTSPDKDAPISDAGRDLTRFAMTENGTGLFLYFKRAGSTNNTVDFITYMDINNNGLMEKREPVIVMSWSGSNTICSVSIWNYNPANSGGDSIVVFNYSNGDGYMLPGDVGSTPRTTIGNNGKGSSDGVELEVYIPWSYISQTNSSGTAINTLGYNMPFKFHNSTINGNVSSIPNSNSVNDNFGGCFGGNISSNGSLPIVLSYFNVYADNNNKAVLNWVTEMEKDNEYYTIERSQDGKNFSSIAMVLGSLNTTSRKTYEYKDNLKGLDLTQTIYYRVKQTDLDGKSTYSPIRSVKLSQKQNMIQVNPNPFVDNITVKCMSEVSGTMNIKVVNMNGQTVINKLSSVIKGFNSVGIYNLGSLPKGLYVVEVMINGEVSEKTKLMKN